VADALAVVIPERREESLFDVRERTGCGLYLEPAIIRVRALLGARR